MPDSTTEPRLLTLGQIAVRLKASKNRVAYAIDAYHITPAARVGILRAWPESDLPRIKSALDRVASNRKGRW